MSYFTPDAPYVRLPRFREANGVQRFRPLGLNAEDLDALALGDRHDGLLPRTGLAGDVAHALGLGLDVQRVDANDVHAEELLDSVLDLVLVGVLGDLERVLVLLHRGVGTLGDDGANDDIIIRPIVSERSYAAMEENKYTFEVAKDANKYQIKDAVQELFGVHVVRVNTLNVKPKTKRVRYVAGKTRSWKKAVVTVAEGESIEVFGVQA